MSAGLTVWGVNVFNAGKQRRAIVAAHTKAEAVRLLGVSRYYLNLYGGDTGNVDELALARSAPGTVFVHMADTSAPFEHGEWVAT